MGNSGRDIPEDVITVVLSRFPVKSLLRCKSVCKSWLSIISNPHFIKSHLHNAVMASKNIPKIANILDPAEFLVMQDLSFTCPVHIYLIAVPPILVEILIKPLVVGCYNGIICLSNFSVLSSVYFWNPSIWQCMRIPSPTIRECCDVSSIWQCMRIPSPTIHECCDVSINFGYDLISNDYKVLKINYLYKRNEPAIIQVYSANANSWREFQSPVVQNWMVSASGNITVNGVLYIDYRQGLISFNLHTEDLGLVSFPSFTQRRMSLAMNFEDSLAMLFQCVNDRLVYLWTLDDVSGKMTWIRRHSVKGNSGSSLWLTLYLGAGLFFGRKLIGPHNHHVLYDYEKNLTRICEPICLSYNIALNYTESLVSLEGFSNSSSCYSVST